MTQTHRFIFRTKVDQILLLGTRARDVRGLAEGIRAAPDASIFFHTHRFLEQHHVISPEPPNDFAFWANQHLGDDVLAEQLSSIDIVQFKTIAELRQAFIRVLEGYQEENGRHLHSPAGRDFHFMSSRIFVLPTPHFATTLSEFRAALARVSTSSVYYHMFDAKLRLEQGDNDFSEWFLTLGQDELAEAVRRLDPYRYTLEGLRKQIIAWVKKHDAD
jgi:hypothetical protein